MTSQRCAEYARLQTEVGEVLERLTNLTQAQLNAFRANDQATLMRLDKELENAIGEKERRIGAMRQHAREHKCQPNSEQ
jgi:cell division septum initiation protein DivIVA